MSILWCGGEDVDFPNGSLTVYTAAGTFRAGYARCSTYYGGTPPTNYRSLPFAGGAVTSAWLTFRISNGGGATGPMVGLTYSGSPTAGVYVGNVVAGGGTLQRIALFLYDGSTATLLSTESGASIQPGVTPPQKVDMSIVGYGASAAVTIWVNGNAVISYGGSIAVVGVSALDQVTHLTTTVSCAISEVIVSTSDTRNMSLCTLAPAGPGTTGAWTGSYTSVNEVTINDSSSVYTNTAGLEEDFTLTSPASGTYTVAAVKTIARASATASSTATKVAVGIRSGGTKVLGPLVVQSTSFAPIETLMQYNPASGSPWSEADLSSLQLALGSG